MKEHDLEPGPRIHPDSWQEFLKRHAETLYECDFFSKRIWTRLGIRQRFVLVFLQSGDAFAYGSADSSVQAAQQSLPNPTFIRGRTVS